MYKNMRAGTAREGFDVEVRGETFYVDTANGSDSNDGRSWGSALDTMARAFALVTDHSVIFVLGDVREQITTPLGVQGVSVIGGGGGNTRHDDGVRWREAAVAGNAPLVTVREQGWEFHNILFVPQTSYSAIKLHREEIAAAMDGSHAVIKGCKFIGNVAITTAGGIGIEDYGGMHHVVIEDNEFNNLVSAIVATNVSIGAPLRNLIRRNIFQLCENDIRLNGSGNTVRDNQFMTKYHASSHPTTVNLAYTSAGTYPNLVLDNMFADAAADVTIAKGYKPSTGDVWRNYVTDTAAAIVAVPA